MIFLFQSRKKPGKYKIKLQDFGFSITFGNKIIFSEKKKPSKNIQNFKGEKEYEKRVFCKSGKTRTLV